MRIGVSNIPYILHNVDSSSLLELDVDEVEFVFEFDFEKIIKGDFVISSHAPFRYVNIGSLSKRHLEFSKLEIERALLYGYETVVHEGNFSSRFDGWEKITLKNMEIVLKDLKAKYSNFLIENVAESVFKSLDDFFEFFAQFNIPICFDVNHYYLKFGGFNKPIQLKDKYKELIRKIHISDTKEGSDLHLPLGEGELDLKMLFSFLKEFKDVSIIVESVPRKVENISSSLKSSINLLREAIIL